jgi:hypothetical protein
VVDPKRIMGKNEGPRRRGTRGRWPPPPKKNMVYVRLRLRPTKPDLTSINSTYLEHELVE